MNNQAITRKQLANTSAAVKDLLEVVEMVNLKQHYAVKFCVMLEGGTGDTYKKDSESD
jgi:hypothetical protein